MKKKIKVPTIALTNLSLGSHAMMHKSVSDLVAEIGADVLHVEEVAAPYREAMETEMFIVKRASSAVGTYELKEADDASDRLIGTLINVVRAHTTNYVAHQREAARILYVRLRDFRALARRGYTAQMAELDALLAYLAKAESATHLATLGLTDVAAALVEANERHQEMLHKKIHGNKLRNRQREINTRDARRRCDDLYRHLVELAAAYAIVAPDPAFDTFFQRLTGIVLYYRNVLAHQGMKRYAADSADPDQPSPDAEAAPDTPAPREDNA